MRIFRDTILRTINDYKATLKRNLSPSERRAKLRKLGIKRACIKNADEVELFNIGLKIIDELEQEITPKHEESENFYYGTEQFLQYLKKLLAEEHTIENNAVINVAQKSSCALIQAIQLIEKAKKDSSDEIIKQVHHCASIIIKYGSKEQKEAFNKIIGVAQLSNDLLTSIDIDKNITCAPREA